MRMVAVVLEDPFTEGRFLLCRRTKWSTTVVSSHCERVSAERERDLLQRQYDRDANWKPVDPLEPRQLILGFYGPEFGDV